MVQGQQVRETEEGKQQGLGGESKGAVDRAAADGKALLDIRFNKPQEFIQSREAAVKISAVSSSLASPIALRTSLATTA